MLSQRYGVFREFVVMGVIFHPHNIYRETSNKALNAINEMRLVPFLMSFLAARDTLPLIPVTSAGRYYLISWWQTFIELLRLAQCLYVLTDDNYPAISDVQADAGYIACLLSIARKENGGLDHTKNVDPRTVTLSVLAAGKLKKKVHNASVINDFSFENRNFTQCISDTPSISSFVC